jgi:surface antigen
MLPTKISPQIRLLSIALLAVAVALAGCASTSNRDIGTGLGALIGGAIGYGIDDGGAAGTAIGVIVGGFIGRQIGQYMDENDQREMARALEHNAAGESSSWHNADTGYHYTTTPTSEVYASQEGQCRDLRQEMTVDGERRVVNGKACKRSPGENWQVI